MFTKPGHRLRWALAAATFTLSAAIAIDHLTDLPGAWDWALWLSIPAALCVMATVSPGVRTMLEVGFDVGGSWLALQSRRVCALVLDIARLTHMERLWLAAALGAIAAGLHWSCVVLPGGDQDYEADLAATARTTAARLSALPKQDRFLLLWERQSRISWDLRRRLWYYLYPRRIDDARGALPADTGTRYGAVVALGTCARLLPPDRPRTEVADGVVISVPSRPAAGLTTQSPALPLPRAVPAAGWAAVIVSFGIVCLLGALALMVCLPYRPFSAWPANLAAAHLTGSGLAAWTVTAWLAATGRFSVGPVYILTAITALAWRRRRGWTFFRCDRGADGGATATPPPAKAGTGIRGPSGSETGPHSRDLLLLWYGCLACAALIGLYGAIRAASAYGLAEDAYSIWALKARAFAVDGTNAYLRHPFDDPFIVSRYGMPCPSSHPDYPLLVPIQTWWAYMHFGSVWEPLVRVVGFWFFLDLVILLAVGARRCLPAHIGYLPAAIAACLPGTALWVCSGCADIPFAALFLAAGVALTRFVDEDDRSCARLASLLMPGLVLAKNEGALAAAAIVAIATWHALRRRDAATFRSTGLILGAGFIAYLPWIAIKHALLLRSDLADGLAGTWAERLSGPTGTWLCALYRRACYAGIQGFFREICDASHWGMIAVLVLVALLYALRRREAPGAALWWLVGIQLAGYIGPFLITPWPLEWHVKTSVARLTLHVVPALLLAAAAACFGPNGPGVPRHGTARGTCNRSGTGGPPSRSD